MHLVLLVEKEIIYVYSIFLILFNLVGLYFIVHLLSYDEIIGYFPNGEVKNENPRTIAFTLMVGYTLNLLFVAVSLMARFFLQPVSKDLEHK